MTDAANNQPAEPSNAAEAQARLAVLNADPKWSNDLFSGNGPNVAQFQKLTALMAAGDDVKQALDGTAIEPVPFLETTLPMKSRRAADWK